MMDTRGGKDGQSQRQDQRHAMSRGHRLEQRLLLGIAGARRWFPEQKRDGQDEQQHVRADGKPGKEGRDSGDSREAGGDEIGARKLVHGELGERGGAAGAREREKRQREQERQRGAQGLREQEEREGDGEQEGAMWAARRARRENGVDEEREGEMVQEEVESD